MKKLLLTLSLALIAIPSFAQIDDVINKPAPKKPAREPLIKTNSMFKYLLNIFEGVEITELVDQMKQDGVTERKFIGVIGINGRISNITWSNGDPEAKVLSFNLRLTQDNKMYLDVAGLQLGNYFKDSVNNGLNPVTHADFAVFKMDQGVNFRDIKTIGFRVVDVDIRIPLRAISSTRYIAIEVGANIGGEHQDIALDNGQVIKVGQPAKENGAGLAFTYTGRSALALKEEVGNGTVELRAGIQVDRLEGTTLGEFTGENGDYTSHQSANRTSLYGIPSITYVLPFNHDRSSASLYVRANIAMVDHLMLEERGTPINGTPVGELNLTDRTRQPVQVGLKITF